MSGQKNVNYDKKTPGPGNYKLKNDVNILLFRPNIF